MPAKTRKPKARKAASPRVTNLLLDPSFESWSGGPTIADSWADYHTTAAQAAYSQVTTGVTDGSYAQKMAYTGQAGDSGAQCLFYQSHTDVDLTPGDQYTLTFWASGSYSGCTVSCTLQSLAGGSGNGHGDTPLTGLSSTPQLYTVTYIIPSGTTVLEACCLVSGIGPGSAYSVTIDQAVMYAGAPAVSAPAGLATSTATARPPSVSAGGTPPPAAGLGTYHWNLMHNDFTGTNPLANVGQPLNLGADVGVPGR